MYDCFILSKVRGSETKYIDKIYFDDIEYLRFKRKKDLKRFLIINTYHL
jgi:hypothetical protein